MRFVYLFLLAICLALAVRAQSEDERKPSSGNSVDSRNSKSSLSGDGGGVNAGGKGSGSGDSSRPYRPPPYIANVQYNAVDWGQTVQTHTIGSKAPTAFYSSRLQSTYLDVWRYGFYPIFPYPWWAYGAGTMVRSTYYGNSYNHGVYTYQSKFLNITVVNATSIPFIGDIDLFDNNNNVVLTEFNNGTIRIAPCGSSTSDELSVDAKYCDYIMLDLSRGSVVAGNAHAQVLNEVTFFILTLGSRRALLRTQTISSTTRLERDDVITGIILGCIGFVALVCVAIWLFTRRRKLAARKLHS
ncbi:hypothetical protein IW146_006933 [Coemansia sp. RSA 922]|nr:hypothetical protein GGI08_002375 [Coemansia sp. S2]KAJ2066919.1 hypothetical protein GGH13_005525 [Coemansia sp. S155-1]KAJ2108231.1 hypothetical protein IW146_006933 [Coemansia sp. RSA 922]